ncbi:MAG TPA: serine hydrolase [Candidatus Acidoferrales bacterium]|nr:serine hydrolase [Candidatus Acidoferrales bacterium]
MRRVALALSIALLVAVACARAGASPNPTPKDALVRLFTADHIDSNWFAQSFLDQVSAAQVETIVGQLKSQLGAFQNVEPEHSKFRVIFARGDDMASIVLDDNGRISGLFFEVSQPRASSFKGALDAFKDLPGHVSVTVLENGAQRAAVSGDMALGVGSSFKLAVLEALKRRIDARTTSWESIVRLEQRNKSLPSGQLQNWPDGSPVDIFSLAALMISESDNTAADRLLAYVGRRNVEAFAPRDRPFLSTREAFILKDPNRADMLKRYRAAGESERRNLLKQIDALPLPDASIFSGGPLATDVEWFFTTRELCSLMRSVEALPLMSINPGVAEASDWKRVAYKGGSEPGVLNLTTWLVAKNGKTYCVSATWNDDKPLEETKFFGLYKSLLANLQT